MILAIPASTSSLSGCVGTLFGGKPSRPSLTPFLATFSAPSHRSRVFLVLPRDNFPVLNLSRGNVHDDFGELAGIAWAFSFVCHALNMARGRIGCHHLSTPISFKLTHYLNRIGTVWTWGHLGLPN